MNLAVVDITIRERLASAPAGVELVCNNPTDKLRFTFDDEWNAHPTRFARFQWDGNFVDVPFTGIEVKVPEITNTLYVNVGVYSDDIASTWVKLKTKRSILCLGGAKRLPISNTNFDQFMAAVNEFNEKSNQSLQAQYTISEHIEDQGSVCVIEDTGADVEAADNSAYFNNDYMVVDQGAYKLNKTTMLALPGKHLTGKGSVVWDGWDTVSAGWKNTEDSTKLDGVLKVRYADDPVYLSMKLPAEPDAADNFTDVIRPLMYKADTTKPVGTYTQLVNMGGIYPHKTKLDSLPDNIVVCVGRMYLYTLSTDRNARWKIHKQYARPDGYGMFYLPWSGMDNMAENIAPGKIEVHDDYVRFKLTADDFKPKAGYVGSTGVKNTGKVLHYWDKHLKTLDLSKVRAFIAFCEVWTETKGAEGLLYATLGVDQKSTDNKAVDQCVAAQGINLTTEKRIAIGHSISNTLYDELRGTPNDPRYVYMDYASVSSSGQQSEVEAMRTELDSTADKIETCFSLLTPSKINEVGYNLNDGVWETGNIGNDGKYEDNYHTTAFRNVNYLPVKGGSEITAYYDAAEWNGGNQGKGLRLVQYDSAKNQIGTTYSVLPTHVAGASLELEANTAYIRVGFNTWGADIATPLKDIKVAIYYIEDARREFIDYGVGGDIEYGVNGDSVVLIAPNGTKYMLAVSNDGTLGIKAFGS